jgi:hypothetical protein
MSLIEDKAREIQEMLEKWASEVKVLRPGEQLIFTLEVQKTSTVLMKSRVSKADLTVREFFTRERVEKAGFSKSHAVRLYNAICRLDRTQPIRDWTIRQLSEWPTFREVVAWRDWKNVGFTARRALQRLLSDAGIDLEIRKD